MDNYIGEIRLFGGNFAPVGWMQCAGQVLQIAENETLYNLLGTTYGGDGMQTFALPDLRGRVPVHVGSNNTGLNVALGEKGGAESVTLTTAQMAAHNHGSRIKAEGTSAKVMVSYAAPTTDVPAAGLSLSRRGGTTTDLAPTFTQGSPGFALNPATLGSVSMASDVQGGSQPHDNMQPYLALTYIIATEGIYPSQP